MRKIFLLFFVSTLAFAGLLLQQPQQHSSGQFTPASLSNLKYMISADCNASSSSCFSLSGSDINSVTDISSNAYVFDGTASSAKPALATNQVNGKPAITFASGAYLKNANNFLTGSSIDFTFYVAFKRNAGGAPYFGEFGGNGALGVDFYLLTGPNIGSGGAFAAYDPGVVSSHDYSSSSTWFALAVTHTSGGTWQFYNLAGGTATAITTTTGSGIGGNVAIGTYLGNYSGEGFPIGAIEEFEMQNSVGTGTELSNMATYFNSKLAI